MICLTKKGAKQGDPLRSFLFNTVLQPALKDDVARWREKGMGICLGDRHAARLSSLRFADDVLLFSKSLLTDFTPGTEKVGLKMHPDATHIITLFVRLNGEHPSSGHMFFV